MELIYRNNQFVASWVYTIGAVQASVIVGDEEFTTKEASNWEDIFNEIEDILKEGKK